MSETDTTEMVPQEENIPDVVSGQDHEKSLIAINGKMIPAQMAEDFETARKNFIELIDAGQKGLISMLELARDTEHPRAFEVLTNMLGTVGNLNKQLVDLNLDVVKTVKDFKDADAPAPQQGAPSIQNNIFVAGTNDVQELFRKVSQGEDIQGFSDGVEKT